MDAKVMEAFESWRANVTEEDLVKELGELAKPEAEDKLYDAFYRSLAFGTAGLRGTIGVGTNRMNVYVVAQATQGLADYLNAHYQNPTVALARDSRLKGEDFQKVAAGVLAANGIRVYVYPRIEPVPTLSFAVRYLKTSAGIVLTASHNPAPTTATRCTTITAVRLPTRPQQRSPQILLALIRLTSSLWILKRAWRRA